MKMILFTSVILTWLQLEPKHALGIDFKFHQNDYKLNVERAIVSSCNQDYFDYFTLTTFKYNRSVTAFNVTLKHKIDLKIDHVHVIVQTFRFASNEYRLFPIRFQLDFCDIFENDIAGLGSHKGCRNFNGCPAEKNKHHCFCNFVPDESKLPPRIPNGKYKVQGDGYLGTTLAYSFYALGEVSRPVV